MLRHLESRLAYEQLGTLVKPRRNATRAAICYCVFWRSSSWHIVHYRVVRPDNKQYDIQVRVLHH